MATRAQIESAARTEKRPVGSDLTGTNRHILARARADEEYERRERARARRHVVRQTGGHECDLVCVAPGHGDSHAEKPCIFDCRHPDHPRDEAAAADLIAMLALDEPEDRPEPRTPCRTCGESKPVSTFPKKPGRVRGLDCNSCVRARRRQAGRAV